MHNLKEMNTINITQSFHFACVVHPNSQTGYQYVPQHFLFSIIYSHTTIDDIARFSYFIIKCINLLLSKKMQWKIFDIEILVLNIIMLP